MSDSTFDKLPAPERSLWTTYAELCNQGKEPPGVHFERGISHIIPSDAPFPDQSTRNHGIPNQPSSTSTNSGIRHSRRVPKGSRGCLEGRPRSNHGHPPQLEDVAALP